ncbi:MAG TPA: anthranilate synthase component I family protein [Gaiellaceae bacterium]|nr:anthranilate synthase component I family protein [Gaiellaceae bacterium]
MPESLELREAEGAFERLEEWLAARGFFSDGADELVAEVYLGYALSDAIRRDDTPAPIEPCPRLPLAACRLERRTLATDCYKGSFALGEWERTWGASDYRAAIEEVREAIARGDVYQVNVVQHLQTTFAGDPRALADRLAPLRPLCPDPFVGDDWAVVSASPELFLARRGDRLWTMPIKGTRPLGASAELRASEKDAAEHVMIVDLERNDLSRVCRPGTVRWPELMATRELAGVEHMVSTVEGSLRNGVGLAEIMHATFPGGSVTGAPKIAAVDLIAELEPVGRGASMGAIGKIYGNGDFDLALTIRTFAIAEGRIHLWVGGGIVWDSDAALEVDESWVKARPLLAAIGSKLPEAVLT